MRIELQEVRNVLLRHSTVEAAEVLAIAQQKSSNWKQRQHSSVFAAFVVLADTISRAEFADTLFSYLRQHLPIQMVPQSIQVVSCWPRTPNGKIDLRTLASWANTNADSAGDCTHDTREGTAITVQLATDILRQVWMQALGYDHFDDDEDIDISQREKRLMSRSFFELGGDSLAAIRAIALAQARGLPLALEQFFCSSSLPEIARSAATSMVESRDWLSEILVPLNWPSTHLSAAMPTLYLFHDAVGTVWKLLELARHLPFAVIGVQAASFLGDIPLTKAQPSSVEELATMYWDVIRQRQSSGPYAFGGFSFGCRVAHEVARLAFHAGHTILPVLLIDGLPFKLPTTQQQIPKAQTAAAPIEIEENVIETFDDSLLRQLQVNYRKFCAMEDMYAPYSTAETEATLSRAESSIWLHADLYMTQHWKADVSKYQPLGIDLTIVATLPDCTHLTMLRHPTVNLLSRQIRHRAKVAVDKFYHHDPMNAK